MVFIPFKDKDKERLYKKIWWKKNKCRYRKHLNMTKIGTSDFSEHREEDFDDEYIEIQKEFVNLRLRKC